MAAKYLIPSTTRPGNVAQVEAIDSSAGAGDAGKIAGLDAAGKWDTSFMPTGVGADTALIEASEDLAAGDWVNIHASTGAKVRKADATTAGKEADGFVLAVVTSGNNATVYFVGTNDQITGLTPGSEYYLHTTGGAEVATAPTGSGNVQQPLGKASSATAVFFQKQVAIELV